MGDGRITDEISRLVEITGHRATEDDFLVLCGARPGRDPANARDGRRVRSTDAGRRYGIQLLAAGKSGEADAVRGLDEQEARLLIILLKRVIRETVGQLCPTSGERRTSGARTTSAAPVAPLITPTCEGNRS